MTQDNNSRPLRALVVGAGLGGLAASIAMRRQGHHVTIFEQSALAREVGAAIHIPPNAHLVLSHLGIDLSDLGAVEKRGVTVISMDGQSVKHNDTAAQAKRYKHKYLYVYRVDLHTRFKSTATQLEGAGPPVQMRTGCRVVDIDIDNVSITLQDGTAEYGDVIVGADGVHSITRTHFTNAKPFHSEYSAYRFVLDRKQAVVKVPELRDVLSKEGQLTFWWGGDRRIVMYPARSNTLLNFVCIHPDPQEMAAGNTTWNRDGRVEDLLKVYEGFDPRALTLLATADPPSLKIWNLMDMDEVKNWHRGHCCLVGDAAHPFLPHQGQGAAQAIEDAAALGCVLPLGTTRADIPSRLQLYQTCRKERAERVQDVTRQAGPANKMDLQKIEEFAEYNYGHDEVEHSSKIVQERLH